MDDVEQQHDRCHQRRIENVEPDLGAEEVPVIALNIFDNAEDRADHDENAGSVEGANVSAPGNLMGLGVGRGRLVEVLVEDDRHQHEIPEEDKLDGQTTDNNPLASYLGIWVRFGQKSCT